MKRECTHPLSKMQRTFLCGRRLEKGEDGGLIARRREVGRSCAIGGWLRTKMMVLSKLTSREDFQVPSLASYFSLSSLCDQVY